jgi:hypothetical protein
MRWVWSGSRGVSAPAGGSGERRAPRRLGRAPPAVTGCCASKDTTYTTTHLHTSPPYGEYATRPAGPPTAAPARLRPDSDAAAKVTSSPRTRPPGAPSPRALSLRQPAQRVSQPTQHTGQPTRRVTRFGPRGAGWARTFPFVGAAVRTRELPRRADLHMDPAARPRVRLHCRFRYRDAECVSESVSLAESICLYDYEY